MLATTAGPLDQRARRQERRAASARSSARRRQVDALSAAAGAVAMVRSWPQLSLLRRLKHVTELPAHEVERLWLLRD